jgi:hypothetical protein
MLFWNLSFYTHINSYICEYIWQLSFHTSKCRSVSIDNYGVVEDQAQLEKLKYSNSATVTFMVKKNPFLIHLSSYIAIWVSSFYLGFGINKMFSGSSPTSSEKSVFVKDKYCSRLWRLPQSLGCVGRRGPSVFPDHSRCCSRQWLGFRHSSQAQTT